MVQANQETALEARIFEAWEGLSVTERRLARVFLTYQADMGHLRKEALIGLAEVSKSTADRLVRRLGYRNYRELQQAVRTDFSWGAPQLPKSHAEAGIEALQPADVAAADQFNISETLQTIDPDELDRVCAIVADARRVWVLGMRAGVGLGEIATHYLGQVRRDVHQMSGDSATWSRDLALLGSGDVLLIFAFRRRPMILPRMIAEARKLGAVTILVTDVSAGASARVADRTLRCLCQSPSPLISFSAVITLINILTLGVSRALGERSHARIREIDRLVQSIESVSAPHRRPRRDDPGV